MKIRRILVAVRDLGHPPRNELRKAAELARPARAHIELFHVVDAPVRTDRPRGKQELDAARRRIEGLLQKSQQHLQRCASSPLLRGLTVSCHSNSDYPPHEAIVRRAINSGADLVIASTRARGFTGRLLLRNTDWELIRQCPCPLLLVKSARRYAESTVLAAVDPFHGHSKPVDLDTRLLEYGNAVAQLVKGTLHAFHAYMPMISVVPMPAGPTVPIAPPPEVEAAHGELVAHEFDQLAQAAGVAAGSRHLHMGDVCSELCAVAKHTRASLVIMGAVSRSGLRRIFIGNTAEQVLDALPCDVLVLKPRGFQSGVAIRPPKAAGLTIQSAAS